jgi:acetyl esterase/lipase
MTSYARAGWLLASCLALQTAAFPAGLPEEKPLWPDPDFKNPIHYDSETVKQNPAGQRSLSGLNRVFSLVSTPSYTIFRASAETANGVGLVICPGGGYRDVWLDPEGNDFALWLKALGVTSLVLKYRTCQRTVKTSQQRSK